MIKNIHDVKECPECGSEDIVYNDKEQQVMCKACGMIYEPMERDEEEQFEEAAGLKEKKGRKKKTKKKK